MKSLLCLAIGGILILSELFLIPHLTIFGVRPNLILMSILSWFILVGEKKALKWLLPWGIILDFFSVLPFGVISLSLFTTLLLVYLISLRVLQEKNLKTVFLISMIGSLIYNLLLVLSVKFFTLVNLSSLRIDLRASLINIVLPSLFYNLLVILLVYKLLRRYHLWLTKFNESF